MHKSDSWLMPLDFVPDRLPTYQGLVNPALSWP